MGVGNVLLSFCLCLFVQLCGMWYLKRVQSSSWNRPFAVFARCHGAMVLFVCLSLLFAPTLKIGLVALTFDFVPMGEKILIGVFSIGIFAGVTFYYIYWSLVKRERK